jgi:uncharacterized membrane protein HdeD (DUF308 family)
MATDQKTMMDSIGTPGGREMLIARQASTNITAFGAVLMALGIFAVLAPLFSGIAITVMIGMLLLISGMVEAFLAFKSDSFGKGALRFLFGALGVVVGSITIAMPMESLGALSLVLAGFLLVGGIMDIVLSLGQKSKEGWGWILFSGIMSILLAALILWQWPVSGVWAIGIYVGFRIMMHGWLLMATGRTGQEALTLLQDTRIEVLERHAREGAQALQETQTALADHAAMLLALESELRKKVSLSEVDPAIQDLNEKLGVARVQMQQASEATKEAWDEAQVEANAAFKGLRVTLSELTKNFKKELGLDSEKKE